MIAIDTNIVVRLITADDERQLASALDFVAREDIFVTLTVMIETEWVLRSRYGYDRAAPAEVDWALSRYALGGELADCIHIAAARPIGCFASFEKKLVERAGSGAPARIETFR